MRLLHPTQANHVTIENNVYDVYRTDNTSYDNPQGIGTDGLRNVLPYTNVTPFTYPQMVIRENLMRRVDGAISIPVQGNLPVGVRVYSVEKGIIQENIIDLDDANPIQHLHSKDVKSFNNTTASGALVRGHDATPPENLSQKDDELATLIEDAIVLSL